MQVKKILFITLSNIGDVVLTLPVLDTLLENFPGSKITVMAGPRPSELFENNPHVERLIVYQKHARLSRKLELFFQLKKEGFDMVVDLRNSLFGALLPAPLKTSSFPRIPRNIKHMRQRHLYKIKNLIPEERRNQKVENVSLYIKEGEEEDLGRILRENGILAEDKIVVVSPGARSHTKRWAKEKFCQLVLGMSEDKMRIIVTGDQGDLSVAEYLEKNCGRKVLNLCAKTTFGSLAALFKKADLLITNDSAVLHLASYLNRPVVSLFGPTNDLKYGPWSDNCAVVKKDIFCRPCEKAQCRFGTLECMRIIGVRDVLRKVEDIFAASHKVTKKEHSFKRILIVRTDRIGDVILSTPVIKALREAYPDSYIAMMVNPYASQILEGNPWLDEVIIYDKNLRHKSWIKSLGFASSLAKKKFDLALILHPTNRVHLVTFFAGIKRRVGYERKLGFLLTDKLRHLKQLGEKHELEYNLDLVRYLGIEPKDLEPFVPLKPEAEEWAEEFFRQSGIAENDRVLALHPGASCPSKIWPDERFAQVADALSERYALKVVLVAGPRDILITRNVNGSMHYPALNLGGKTSLSQLASVLKRCALFISNDSGPVHIASALGTPVISIFGRGQKGLGPKRWAPRGEKDKVLHKDVGCIQCLAHNCRKDYSCLKAITVEDVIKVADSILRGQN